jgi:hypothetical protein
MRGRFTIMVAVTAAVLAFGPAAAWAASDPATAVQDDLAALTTDFRSAQSILLPDIQNLKTDMTTGNAAALKSHQQKLRTDLKSVLATVQKLRKQLASDVGSAHAVGLNVSSNASAKDGPVTLLRNLEQQVRTVLKSSRTAKSKTPKTKTPHTHTAKHGQFVKHHVQKHTFTKHAHTKHKSKTTKKKS